jgi:hypothetical protein
MLDLINPPCPSTHFNVVVDTPGHELEVGVRVADGSLLPRAGEKVCWTIPIKKMEQALVLTRRQGFRAVMIAAITVLNGLFTPLRNFCMCLSCIIMHQSSRVLWSELGRMVHGSWNCRLLFSHCNVRRFESLQALIGPTDQGFFSLLPSVLRVSE